VVSAPQVSLSQNAEITGTLLTNVSPSEQSGAEVDGGTTVGGALFSAVSWNVSFPAMTLGDLRLSSGQTASLAPGSYGTVLVPQGATLALSSGTYTFASLSVDTGGTITGATASGSLIIYVQTSLHLYGSIVPSGGPSTFLLGYAGTSDLLVQSAFSGTLVAPLASLTLASLSNAGAGQQGVGHRGAFIAASLDVHQCVDITHVAFNGWSSIAPQ
jgi:hypothetical protein